MNRRFVIFAALLLTACAPPPAPILLFTGTGTSANDVTAIETILARQRLTWATATSAQMNRLTPAQLSRYRLLIVPGGNFERIGNSLDAATTNNIRAAVHNGLNYLGICAGAFFAGNSPSNGLNLTAGVRFPFYSAEARGIRKVAVRITGPDASSIEHYSLEHYWEDGPQLTGWGEVVAAYPDGTPAIAQGRYGRGWLVLTGTHPEAPASWRQGLAFHTPVAASQDYAATLIDAALNNTPLPHY